MRNPRKHMRFVALLIAAPLYEVAVFLLQSRRVPFVPVSGTSYAAIILGSIAFARREGNGFTSLQFARAAFAIWAKWMLFYLGLIVLLGATIRDSSMLMALVLDWAIGLAPFATACQAYFGLGKFHSRGSHIARARHLLQKRGDSSFGWAASPSQIAEAERMLGLYLPVSYKEFLLTLAEIRSLSIRVLGITPNTDLAHPSVEDCVGATLHAREHFSLPRSYVLCAVDTDERLVCLDTLGRADGEGPVVGWNPETRTAAGWLAPSFGEYLLERFEQKG